jgi:hypothetical protein
MFRRRRKGVLDGEGEKRGSRGRRKGCLDGEGGKRGSRGRRKGCLDGEGEKRGSRGRRKGCLEGVGKGISLRHLYCVLHPGPLADQAPAGPQSRGAGVRA